ncbi:MAG: hypothetical protein IMY72_11930 [Bacteroidetes bacterium]|nr:hypothetical protein [Bacteroidota bacterium]
MNEKEIIKRIEALEFDHGVAKIYRFARIEALETVFLKLVSEIDKNKIDDYLKIMRNINYKSIINQINELPEHLHLEYFDFFQKELHKLKDTFQ